jgi:WD40 repeat protein
MIKRLAAAFIAAAGVFASPAALSNTLYVSTSTDSHDAGAQSVRGDLYTVDPVSARAKLIGPIRVGGVLSVGVTGLAIHPATAVATLVGPLGKAGSDINFDSHGTLFIWLRDDRRLGTVDLATGRATAMGVIGVSSGEGGLAIDRRGSAFLASSDNTLEHIDTRTGKRLSSHELRGAPLAGPINSLTLSPSGVLVAINAETGSAKSALVMINSATGAVTKVGQLPDDAEGLTFFRDAAGVAASGSSKMGLLFAMLGILLVLGVLGKLRWRKTRD